MYGQFFKLSLIGTGLFTSHTRMPNPWMVMGLLPLKTTVEIVNTNKKPCYVFTSRYSQKNMS